MLVGVCVLDSLLSVLVRFGRMLQGLTGVFLSRLVVLLAVVLRSAAMGVRRQIVQFRGQVMILVVRSVIVTGGHL
jgi:hypothetical protein